MLLGLAVGLCSGMHSGTLEIIVRQYAHRDRYLEITSTVLLRSLVSLGLLVQLGYSFALLAYLTTR